MSSYIPPELVHQIISYLHNDTKSLSACALTARDWLPSTRHHRFRSIRLHSAKQIDSFHQFSRDAPDILPYYQEAIISSGYVDESVLEAAATVCLTLPNLERIKFSNRSCASPPRVLTILSPVANKITALSLSGTFLTSSKDFWPLICSFPNLNTVQASGVTFLSTSETAFELTNAYEPPITTFSISASRQDFVIDHLVNPPFPLRFLKNFEIRTTDTHQTSLVPLAESIQETVERLTFFAISIHGPDDQRMPDFVAKLTNLNALIIDRVNVPRPGTGPMESLLWIPLMLKRITAPIRRLHIQLLMNNVDHLDSVDWSQVDQILTNPKSFPWLTEVRLSVLPTSPICRTIDAVALRTSVGRRLPVTSQRGILRCLIEKP